jgi:predicted CoA-binding protein
MSDNPRKVLEDFDTVAVVGLSTDPTKAAHAIPAVLQRAGFRVIPVHPSATEVLGEKAYASLADIPEPVDIVEVFRPAGEAPAIARQAAAIGAKALWLQLGIVSDEAGRIAEEAGLRFVQNRCMGQETSAHGIRKTRKEAG